MPYNGTITGLSVNNLKWFVTNDQLDIIKISVGLLTSYGPNLPDFTTVTFPITGYTKTFTTSSFSAGDGLACVIRAGQCGWTLPFTPRSGIVSITIYVKFTS